MKKMWIMGSAVVLFLSACSSASNMSESDSDQYIQGYSTFQRNYEYTYHPSGNYGYPGYEPPRYEPPRYDDEIINESNRDVTRGDVEDDKRRDRRGG
jgi:hypothetical protein